MKLTCPKCKEEIEVNPAAELAKMNKKRSEKQIEQSRINGRKHIKTKKPEKGE